MEEKVTFEDDSEKNQFKKKIEQRNAKIRKLF